MQQTAYLASLTFKCPEEKGQLTKQYRSYDNTVRVIIDVIPDRDQRLNVNKIIDIPRGLQSEKGIFKRFARKSSALSEIFFCEHQEKRKLN
jgi:hypothetical protein